jgi:hypothetical protein
MAHSHGGVAGVDSLQLVLGLAFAWEPVGGDGEFSLLGGLHWLTRDNKPLHPYTMAPTPSDGHYTSPTNLTED